MGLFDFFHVQDINTGVKECRDTNGVLVDVRTQSEYEDGRIPGSRNIPLQEIDTVSTLIADRAAPIYVYCRSGARSRAAAQELQKMGYTAVRDLGGIHAYRGGLEK